MNVKTLLSAVFTGLLLTFNTAPAFGWTNPMELPGLEGRSLGDPYIMKYKGYYYLYVSARDKEIYCWKSKDLVEWSEPYVCCTDTVTSGAYAPEVIYWNGTFHMCTSPQGRGHYMLTSDSPTGPFVHQTGNLGRDIDGSFFIDDDGTRYFYHANNEGIRGCTMPTPFSLGDDVDLGCCISGQWTEGPCVFKRNGLYYLIYTGNHVWTNGYRIDYAVSAEGPLRGFKPQKEQNPILVDTETPTHKALGHGTAFIGPDLDTYFFCYHNLQDNKARRLLNFERMAWNGDKLIMTGPTDWEQEPPLVAQCDYFEREDPGQDWILSGDDWKISDFGTFSQTRRDGIHTALFDSGPLDDYTAEFTIRLADADKGEAGALFSYADAGNYGEAVVDAAEMTFNIRCYADNSKIFEMACPLPVDFRPDTWHSVRIEKNGRELRAFIDGMRKCVTQVDLRAGLIGYITGNGAADFAYIAASPFVDGNGILEVSLPVPGTVDAALSANQCASSYKINVKADGIYNLGIRYQSAGARINISADGETVAGDILLPDTKGSTAVFTVKDLPLKGGLHEISFETTAGTADFKQFTFKPAVLNPRVLNDDFSNGISELWGYREGEWTVADGRLESTGKYGKMLIGAFGDIHMTDYTAECDIIYVDGDMNGGLLFRVTNPSTGGADDNPVLGTDFLQGYILMADGNSLTLGKHNFGWQPLVSVPVEVDPALPHHLKVETASATFSCYLDDMDTPLIVYTDPDPFITGRAGLRCHNSKIRFDNFAVTPAGQSPSADRSER